MTCLQMCHLLLKIDTRKKIYKMKFRCPHCQQKLEADKEFLEFFGGVFDCPSCDGEITAPYDQTEIEKFLQLIDVFVDYEAQARDELPVLEKIKDTDNFYFTNHEVCFTGFDADEKQELKELAVSIGMIPRASVTKNLTMLICGRNAGPVKMEKAKERGLTVLTIQEFKSKLEKSQTSS